MNRNLLIILFLLICSPAYAEYWICQTGGEITVKIQGDCKALGLCSGFNNSGLREDCFEAIPEEFAKAQQQYVKVDMNIVNGSRVIDKTQQEIDAIVAAQAQAVADAKAASISALDTKLEGVKLNDLTLTKVDAKIDAISNLAEAKAFLKLLVRGIVKLEGGL